MPTGSQFLLNLAFLNINRQILRLTFAGNGCWLVNLHPSGKIC